MHRICEQAAYLAGNGTVDRQNKLIRNVKLCGLKSVNCREYEPGCLKEAARLLEGIRVFLDHVGDPSERKIGEEFGRIQNVRFEDGDGLRGDLRYYESCAKAPHLLEIIEDSYTPADPDNRYTGAVGLSPVWYTDARDTALHGRVSKIHKVESVDIVTFPATTRSIREHIEDHTMDKQPADAPATWTKYAEGLDAKTKPAFVRLCEELGMDMGAPMGDAGDHTDDLMNAVKKLLAKGDDGSKKLAKKIFGMLVKAGVEGGDEEAPEDTEKVEEGEYEEGDMKDEEKKEESAAQELAKERLRYRVLKESVQAGYSPDDDDIDDLCALKDDERRRKWIKEAAAGQKRKTLRSEGPGLKREYKTQEQQEAETIDAVKNRIKEYDSLNHF